MESLHQTFFLFFLFYFCEKVFFVSISMESNIRFVHQLSIHQKLNYSATTFQKAKLFSPIQSYPLAAFAILANFHLKVNLERVPIWVWLDAVHFSKQYLPPNAALKTLTERLRFEPEIGEWEAQMQPLCQIAPNKSSYLILSQLCSNSIWEFVHHQLHSMAVYLFSNQHPLAAFEPL